MAGPNEYPASEGLQVVPAHEGLQVVPAQPGLEVAPAGGLEKLDKAGNPAYQGIEVAPADGLEGAEPGHRGAATYCGLRKRTFAIVAGIILVVVIVAAVVGGVVGSRNSSSSNSSPADPAVSGTSSSSISPTKTGSQTKTSSHSTSSTTTGPVPTTSLALDCPAINATTRTIKSSKTDKSYAFDLYCESNYAPGHDIGFINATSLNECVRGCIDFLELGATCVAVVWDSIMNLKIGHNCFFKNSKEGGLLFSDHYDTHPAAAVWRDSATSGGTQ